MKKIISILLIVLLLFNALGFYGLFVGLRYKTKSDLIQRLDNRDYAKDETITLAIPITIPYQLGSNNEFERVDGEIEHKGEFYRLVEQKLQNDTLYIVCIKDHESMRIKQGLTDYVKTFTDKPVDSKHSGKTLFSVIKDFLPTSIQITAASVGWNYTVDETSSCKFFFNRSTTVFSPPPQS